MHWDASVIDDDIARDILEELYNLHDTVADGAEGLENRLGERGLQIEANSAGALTQVRHSAVGAGVSRVPGPSPER